ncbi:hypothetical protein MSIMFI_05476 [Mycobacterium simulans]|nr:hypothetical protein MSIMFI_05476 [Mycobacterium simulans]
MSQRGVEQGDAVFGADRGQAGPGDAGLVDVGEVGGHAGRALPVAPGQAGGAGAVVGQGIEDGVGCGVVGLAGIAQGGRGRGEHDESGQVLFGGELV